MTGSSGRCVQLWSQIHLKWFNFYVFYVCNGTYLSKSTFWNILNVAELIYWLYWHLLMFFEWFFFYVLIPAFCQGSLDVTKVEIIVTCNHLNFKGRLERQWLNTFSPLSRSSLNMSPDVCGNNCWDVHTSISAPHRRELRSQTRQSLPLVHGQPWEGHQRLTVLYVSNIKPYHYQSYTY